MKRVYETPEIEYDDFSLDSVVCANLYGSPNGASPEFYSIGDGNGAVSNESGMGDGSNDGDIIIRPRG
ncbi:MAG: hypothetical protein ACI4HL_03885 [Ruminococcus sp.]